MTTDQEHIWTTEELIEHQGFIAYVRGQAMSKEQAYWDSYCARQEDEKPVLQARAFILALVSTDREVLDADIDQLRAEVQSQIRKPATRRMTWHRYAFRWAAVFIGILAIGYFMIDGPEQIVLRTAGAEIEEFILPDGSQVTLNASSSLTYQKSSFNKSDRILQLNGQAFFNVEKGKPFVVQTAEGNVTVLGTSFDVYQRDDDFIVACKSGQVRVSDHANQSAILSPGQEVSMSSNKMNKIKKSLDQIGSWGKGTFYYEAVRLRKILDEVERQFNAKIVCQPVGLGDQLYSGYFINTHLDSALMSICWPLRIQYEHRDNRIIVSRQ